MLGVATCCKAITHRYFVLNLNNLQLGFCGKKYCPFFSLRYESSRRSYNEVLGVPRNATREEIKKAYLQKVKEYHPDKHPDCPEKHEKMKQTNEAYNALYSSCSRRAGDDTNADFYERARHRPPHQRRYNYNSRHSNAYKSALSDLFVILCSKFFWFHKVYNFLSPRKPWEVQLFIVTLIAISIFLTDCCVI
ncbi:unnamed protein product [Clavelina lepadiformis]|uniref:J domain-containing protein n=1 Tax=Clavelina lepadiformis TaxID=159417 RepID=A0ABP0GT74_CLALP